MEIVVENNISTSGTGSFTERPLIQIYAVVDANITKYPQFLKVAQFAAPSAFSIVLFLVVIGLFMYLVTQTNLVVPEASYNPFWTTGPVCKDVQKNKQPLRIPSVSIKVPVEESPKIATLNQSHDSIDYKKTLQLLAIIKKILGHLNRNLNWKKLVANKPANTADLTWKRDVTTKEMMQEIIDATALKNIYSSPESSYMKQP